MSNLFNSLWTTSTLTIFLILILYLLFVFIIIFFLRQYFVSQKYPLKFIIRILLYSGIVLFVLLIGAITGIFAPKPEVSSPSSPLLAGISIDKDNPLHVKFTRPINTSQLSIEITPNIEGEWRNKSGWLGSIFMDEITFIPEESLPAEEEYVVNIRNISNRFFQKNNTGYSFTFHTLAAPKVVAVSPISGKTDVNIKSNLVFNLDHLDPYSYDYDFEFQPEVDFTLKKNGSNIIIKPAEDFQKGINYCYILYQKPQTYSFKHKKIVSMLARKNIFSGNFETSSSRIVQSVSPVGQNISVNTPITIQFIQDMDRLSVERSLRIVPATGCQIAWKNDKSLSCQPKTWQKNTLYIISVNGTPKTNQPSNSVENYSFRFKTVGPVVIRGTLPENNADDVATTANIEITFNQPVSKNQAQNNFQITPSLKGTFHWTGNKMVFSHGVFQANQQYTVAVLPNIKAIHGLQLDKKYKFSFRTKQLSHSLKIPSFRQRHKYSCFATAVKSALAYRKISLSETQILNQIGYDKTAWSGKWKNSNAVWGDPDIGIVGDINGNKKPGWGYGAHWVPVAKAISKYRPNEVKTNWTVQGIAQEISKGNPVIVWWVNGIWPAYEVHWKTKNGKEIRAVNSMHVQVVRGFKGTIQNPTSFMVTDSGYGYPGKTIKTSVFKAKWRWFHNSAIIVR